VGAEDVAEEYVVARESIIETEAMVEYDKLQPGAHEALDFLANHGDLVLVTLRTRRDLLEQQLARWNLASRFSMVISGDSGIKPRWLIKQRMVKDALPDRKILAIIGDTETDILAGKALGCTTIAVLSGIRNRDRLLNIQPDHIVAGLASVGAEELLSAQQVLHIAPRELENRRPAPAP
jgi:phosphoglycolate phosphatase